MDPELCSVHNLTMGPSQYPHLWPLESACMPQNVQVQLKVMQVLIKQKSLQKFYTHLWSFMPTWVKDRKYVMKVDKRSRPLQTPQVWVLEFS